MTTVLIRGRCCELLAEPVWEAEHSAEMFLVGLCSMLDAMLGRPMDDALGDLPLSPGARDALLGCANEKRTLLDAVIAYEQGHWEDATEKGSSLGVGGRDLAAAYAASLRWARELVVST